MKPRRGTALGVLLGVLVLAIVVLYRLQVRHLPAPNIYPDEAGSLIVAGATLAALLLLAFDERRALHRVVPEAASVRHIDAG